MKTIVPVMAGPFKDKHDAIMWLFDELINNNGTLHHINDIRHYYHGWYIMDRSLDTHHVGNKAERRKHRNFDWDKWEKENGIYDD